MADEYRLAPSEAANEELRQGLLAANAHGVLPVTLRAARWIMEELRRTPLSFGESRDYLPHLELHMRVGFARPLSVHFAVHERTRQVFIRSFRFTG
jgi:hypothetical protein